VHSSAPILPSRSRCGYCEHRRREHEHYPSPLRSIRRIRCFSDLVS
jgi:hypothetical protein